MVADNNYLIILVLILLTCGMRAIFHSFYYKRGNEIISTFPADNISKLSHIWYDRYIFFLPFLWVWLDIGIAIFATKIFDNLIFWIFLIIFVSGRFRALQEISHMTVHKSLCNSEKMQDIVANSLFQFLLFRPDMYHRRLSHMKHHFNANNPELDPNVHDFLRIGFKEGISTFKFIMSVIYPITPYGILNNISVAFKNSIFLNKNYITFIIRFSFLITYFFLLYYIGGIKIVVLTYLIPAFTIYPLFAWLSQVVEHRWFIQTEEINSKKRECIVGRPTDYDGISGFLIRQLIFPFGDSYHLAHSLYPKMHWKLLSRLDKKLKKQMPYYGKYISNGLIFSSNKKVPSALSELKNRLVR